MRKKIQIWIRLFPEMHSTECLHCFPFNLQFFGSTIETIPFWGQLLYYFRCRIYRCQKATVLGRSVVTQSSYWLVGWELQVVSFFSEKILKGNNSKHLRQRFRMMFKTNVISVSFIHNKIPFCCYNNCTDDNDIWGH